MARRLRVEDFPDWSSYYREYQIRLTRDHLLPLLRRWGLWSGNPRVLDVGCGDGGAALALDAAGGRVDGLEIETRRLAEAQEEVRRRGVAVRLAFGDITDPATLDSFAGPYDLILFRDVLEHIPDKETALRQARARLAEGGSIVVVFPPYLSAYGGHQQILHPRRFAGLPLARLPWTHCLPVPLFRFLASCPDGREDPQWAEIRTIAATRLTMAEIARLARDLDLEPVCRKNYLLRPSFRLRYGLPVVDAGWLGRIPGLNELLVSASYQVLRPRRAQRR